MSTQINRRDFLGKSLLATALAGASARSLEEATFLAAVDGGKAATDGKPSPDSDEAVPRGKLGKLEVSRLIMGGNLIGGWAHSRDLIYASSLFKAYNTQEKIFETMALAEAHGVNTILLNPAYLSTAREYNQKHGGKLQVISEIHPPIEGAVTDQQLWDEARRLIDAGADTIYIQGNVGDQLVRAGRLDVIAKTVEAVKSEGLCAGVGGHHNGPLPAVVAGEHREEAVGGGRLVIETHAEVIPDGVSAELHHGRAGLLHRTGEQGGDIRRRLGRGTVFGVDQAVHHR